MRSRTSFCILVLIVVLASTSGGGDALAEERGAFAFLPALGLGTGAHDGPGAELAPASALLDFRQGGGIYRWTRKAPKPQGDMGIQDRPSGDRNLLQGIWRSALMPGWGEIYMGAGRRGGVFISAEAGIWGTFGIFKIQEKLRRDHYIEMAQVFADVQSDGHDSDYWKAVGQHRSSEAYNEYVYLYARKEYGFGTSEYYSYIGDNLIRENESWIWNNADRRLDFLDKRQASLDAERRATYTLYALLINRVISIVDVWRLSRTRDEIAAHTEGDFAGLDLRVAPGTDGLSVRLGWVKSF